MLLSLSTLLQAQSAVVDDTFADGERNAQSLPQSLAIYTGMAARANLVVRDGALTLVANGSQRDVWGYFPAINLNIGDSLSLSIDFRWTNTPPNISTPGLKLALCHTNGVAARTSDGVIPAGPYQGYGSFTNPADASSGTNVRKRNGPAAGNPTSMLLELTDGDSSTIWSSLRTGLSGTQQGNTLHTVTLTITRIGEDSAEIRTSIVGGTLPRNNTMVVSDTSGIFSMFDTIAIGAANSVAYGDLQVTRVRLMHEVSTARLINLSILTSVARSGESFSLGYVVGGSGVSGMKPLVIRAVGPSLAAVGLAGVLDDPKLQLFAAGARSGENDNWGGGALLRDAMAQVGAFAYAGADSKDAAILTNVSSGINSTVEISAAGSGTGAVLAEIYDATPSAAVTRTTPRLTNVSVLKEFGTGITVGFVVGGNGLKRVLIRAIGPTLAAPPFGVVGAIADPRMALFSGSTQIAANDNWGSAVALATAFAQVGAFVLPGDSRDAALLATLGPGNYTVRVEGVGAGTGIGLVEVYELP